MIEININPIALTVGSIKIGWGLIWALAGGIAAILLFVILARRSGLKKSHILYLSVIVIVSGYIGAVLFSIVENFIAYYGSGITSVGLRADGFPIAALTAVLIYARITKLSFWQLLDMGTPCLILFMAVYRVGCVMGGCCYGLPCDQPWAVTYTNPGSIAPLGTPIYPTQLFHLIWNVIVLALVWVVRKSFKAQGALGLFGWILYFAGDFAIRFFRGNEPPVLLLSLSEITDLILIVVATYFLIQRSRTADTEKSC